MRNRYNPNFSLYNLSHSPLRKENETRIEVFSLVQPTNHIANSSMTLYLQFNGFDAIGYLFRFLCSPKRQESSISQHSQVRADGGYFRKSF